MTAMILGVAGGTGSGKTTVAREILEAGGAEPIAPLAPGHNSPGDAVEKPAHPPPAHPPPPHTSAPHPLLPPPTATQTTRAGAGPN